MRNAIITIIGAIVLFGLLRLAASISGDSSNIPICYSLGVVLILLLSTLRGILWDSTKPEGVVYVPRRVGQHGDTHDIIRIDNDVAKEHDNRDETGYW